MRSVRSSSLMRGGAALGARAAQALQGFEQGAAVAGALGRVLLEEREDEDVDFLGNPAALDQLRGRLGLFCEVLGRQLDGRGGQERRLAREHFVEQRAEGVHVAAAVGDLAEVQLGGSKTRGDDHAEHVACGPRAPPEPIGTRVDQVDLRARLGATQQHVFELQIPVDEPLVVDRRQHLQDPLQEGTRLVQVHRPHPADLRREGLGLEEGVAEQGSSRYDLREAPGRDTLMAHRRHEPGVGEVAPGPAPIDGDLRADHPENHLSFALLGPVGVGQRPLADLLRHGEIADRVARGQLIDDGQAVDGRLPHLGCHLGPQGHDGVRERVEAVLLAAVLHESPREGRRGGRPPYLIGG